MTVLKAYIIGALYAALCLGFSLVLYKLGAEKRYTRKLVHILIGFEWIILNNFIGASYHLLIICLAFLALVFFSYKKGLMRMISSDGDNAPGTVYFCVSMSVMSLFSWLEPRFMLPFGIAVFCTSLGDGFAGVIGQAIRKFNPKIWKSKTLFGTAASFILSLAVCIVFNAVCDLKMSVAAVLFIAVFASVLELVTGSGLDNISLPLGVFTLSYFLIYYPAQIFEYAAPILLTPLLLAVVIDKKLLTPAGIAAAAILDLAVSIAFGSMGFIMMVIFLVGGVLIDKIKRKARAEHSSVEKKDDKTRDAFQVIANGLPAVLFSAAYIVYNHTALLIAFCAAVAEAFADTCASGFGAFSKNTFDPFKMRKIQKGMSGGMSVIGTFASLIGALAVAIVPFGFGAIELRLAVLVFGAAFAGALFDSFMGSVFQVKYRCVKCGSLTESDKHCGLACAKVAGLAAIDNDIVNLASGSFSAVGAFLAYMLVFA